MAIVFPDNPTLNQVTTTGGQAWAWNGEAWVSSGSLSIYYYTLPDASPTTLGGVRVGSGLAFTYTSPWTATITGMGSTTGLAVNDVITATNNTGSIGTGGTYTITSIVSPTSITFQAAGGTTPLAGIVTAITRSGTNFASGTVGSITGANGTLNVVGGSAGATGATGPSGGNQGATGVQGATGLNGTNGQPGASGATGATGVQGATGA